MQKPINPHATAKHALTLLNTVYEAAKQTAAGQGLDTNEFIVNLITEAVIEDGTLDPYTEHRFTLTRDLITDAARIARRICREGKFSEHITRDTIAECTGNDQWCGAYRLLIEDDIYKHGNPLKMINREFGYRIRAAIGGTVKKDAEGRPINAKVAGMIIQTYTLMDSFDAEHVQALDGETNGFVLRKAIETTEAGKKIKHGFELAKVAAAFGQRG